MRADNDAQKTRWHTLTLGVVYTSSHHESLRERRPGLREFVKTDVILTFRRVWKRPSRHRYVNRTPQILDTTTLRQHEYWLSQILGTTNNWTRQISGQHRYLGILDSSWFPPWAGPPGKIDFNNTWIRCMHVCLYQKPRVLLSKLDFH